MLADILALPDFRDFHAAMMRLSERVELGHTMIGFNYLDGSIVSTKFYYVFRDDVGLRGGFPVPGLEAEYRRAMAHASAFHLGARLVPGAGLTLTIKFDPLRRVSSGFFFRVVAANDHLVDNIIAMYPELDLGRPDFDAGYGQYVLIQDGTTRTSKYVYLKAVGKLEAWGRRYGIDFSGADCVEIAAADSADKSAQKFITIGLDDRMGSDFLRRVPPAIADCFSGLDYQLCCPAIAPASGQASVYVIGRLNGGKFSCSPVEEMVGRTGSAQ